MIVHPSVEAVASWNAAYAEHVSALFSAMRSEADDVAAVLRLARAYHRVACRWMVLADDLGVPLWARHAASVAAEEFERRARLEALRADPTQR